MSELLLLVCLLSTCLPICLPYLFACGDISNHYYRFNYLRVEITRRFSYLFTYLFVYLFIYLSICLFIYLSIYLPIYLFVYKGISLIRLSLTSLFVINSNIAKLIDSNYEKGLLNESTKIQDLKVTIHNLNTTIQEFNIIIIRLRALRDLYRISHKKSYY